MNPKQFLVVGGIVLVLVAVLGFFGVIGPTAEQSVFGDTWWFDNAENWTHLVLGVVAVIAAFVLPSMAQKWLVVVVGVLGLVVAVWGFTVAKEATPNFFAANLENVADNVLHLVVGAWALLASMGKQE